jgi:hypothetical protein
MPTYFSANASAGPINTQMRPVTIRPNAGSSYDPFLSSAAATCSPPTGGTLTLGELALDRESLIRTFLLMQGISVESADEASVAIVDIASTSGI